MSETPILKKPRVNMDDVAEWVGLHYKVNYSAESSERQKEWVERYLESNPQKPQSLTFGFVREDGDLQALATVNNLDGHLKDDDFTEFAALIQSFLSSRGHVPVQAFAREDVPDYVEESTDGEFESQAVYLPSWDQEYAEARRHAPRGVA